MVGEVHALSRVGGGGLGVLGGGVEALITGRRSLWFDFYGRSSETFVLYNYGACGDVGRSANVNPIYSVRKYKGHLVPQKPGHGMLNPFNNLFTT